MKKFFVVALSALTFAVIVSMIAMPSRAISSSKFTNPSMTSSIPDSVSAILEKSCFPCHSEPGNGMAMMKLNFDKWETYTLEKKADKAKAMCKKVSAGKMPTSSFRKNNPEKVPTEKETNVLCNWSNSFEKK
jgi:hypothetical protein